MKYKLISVDPPWSFNNKNTGGNMKSGSAAKYKTMTLEEMKALDVPGISADNCILFMWYVSSQPKEAIELAESWGFEVKNINGFVWVKTSTAKGRDRKLINLFKSIEKVIPKKYLQILRSAIYNARYILDFNMGHYTRSCSESCLIATKGRFKREKANIRNVVLHRKLPEHSAKPQIFYDKMVELCGDIPRLEMFARDKKFGWDLFGDEVEESIKIGTRKQDLKYLLKNYNKWVRELNKYVDDFEKETGVKQDKLIEL